VGIGRFPDGRLAEILINAAKSGTEVEAAARDAAIVASLALQSGTSPETLSKALSRNSDGSPGGALAAALDLFTRA
jgi:hypothetical protein